MGADSVVVCYGLRYSLGADGVLTDADLEPFERNTDHRIVTARRVGLRSHFGKVTDGGSTSFLSGQSLVRTALRITSGSNCQMASWPNS
jgi:hypothetical protein